jgi:hypothetical protein
MVLCAAFTSEQAGTAGSAPVNVPVTHERPSCCVWWREGEVSECKEFKAMNEWKDSGCLSHRHTGGGQGAKQGGALAVSRQTETQLSSIEPCAVWTVPPTALTKVGRRARLPVVLRVRLRRQ